uniref:Putative ovule protein n=2 Tax=Solanum chacoense TaxID=4108 RepID=A0A0V0HLV2_SOLCH
MKENIFQKMFFNFLMFGWVKCFGKCFPNQLIFLKFKENDFPSKLKENIFQNSLPTSNYNYFFVEKINLFCPYPQTNPPFPPKKNKNLKIVFKFIFFYPPSPYPHLLPKKY